MARTERDSHCITESWGGKQEDRCRILRNSNLDNVNRRCTWQVLRGGTPDSDSPDQSRGFQRRVVKSNSYCVSTKQANREGRSQETVERAKSSWQLLFIWKGLLEHTCFYSFTFVCGCFHAGKGGVEYSQEMLWLNHSASELLQTKACQPLL